MKHYYQLITLLVVTVILSLITMTIQPTPEPVEIEEEPVVEVDHTSERLDRIENDLMAIGNSLCIIEDSVEMLLSHENEEIFNERYGEEEPQEESQPTQEVQQTKVVVESSPKTAPISNTSIIYEIDDVTLLAKLIYAEADPNSTEDNQYVAAVVANRVDYGYWGDTVKDVIYAPGQYSCTWNGSKKFASDPPEYCMEIAQAVLNGERYGVPASVIFQAGFMQGSGLWKKIGNTYYCHWTYAPEELS